MTLTRIVLAVCLVVTPGCLTAANWFGPSVFLPGLESNAHEPLAFRTPGVNGIQALALEGNCST